MQELSTAEYGARDMPAVLLRKALQTLVRRGRAQVFRVTADRWNALLATDLLAQASDDTMQELGVKFV